MCHLSPLQCLQKVFEYLWGSTCSSKRKAKIFLPSSSLKNSRKIRIACKWHGTNQISKLIEKYPSNLTTWKYLMNLECDFQWVQEPD